jgi:hypothetical protein
VQQQKRLHELERETLPLRKLKEQRPQEEENVLAVGKKAALREKHLREKVALREKHLREKAALRNEKDKQSLTLKAPFLFF